MAEHKGKLNDQQVREIIDDLKRRFARIPERVEMNRQDLFCLPERDPVMPDHLKDAVTPWQWDGPRQKWVELKARLTENHYIAQCEPAKPTSSWREKAERLESVFNDGIAYAEERDGIDIQGSLADGQIVDGNAFLHWVKADHLWPDAGDYEEADEAHEGMEWDEERGKYRETDDAYQDRRRHAIARAGWPWVHEILSRDKVSYYPDKTCHNGLGMVLVCREVGTLAYFNELEDAEKRKLLGLGDEPDAPRDYMPSSDDWGPRTNVYQLWTRQEYYEVCEGRGGSYVAVKCFPHPYEMPPFAKCAGDSFNTDDPLLCDLPALEGMFRHKAHLDRLMTLYLALAETVALPLYYWRNVESGAPLLGDDGSMLTLTRNSLASFKAPQGYTLEAVTPDLHPAFISGVQMFQQYAAEAGPSTGKAEVNQNTDPWAIRLQQAQENVVPNRYVKAAAKAITTMFRNMALVMAKPAELGGFGEPIAVYKRMKNGVIDRTTTVFVEPEDIASLDITGSIGSTSAQERITKVEHGKGLLSDGLITRFTFYKDYYEAEDPDRMIIESDAEAIADEYLQVLIKQELAKKYGTRVVVGQNGELVGPGGVIVDPMQWLRAAGVQLEANPQAPAEPGGPAPGSVMQSGPGDLAPLASPNGALAPLPGLVQ